MRTYDDTFSGQRIYPGKVCLPLTLLAGHLDWEEKEMRLGRCEEEDMSDVQHRDPRNALVMDASPGSACRRKILEKWRAHCSRTHDALERLCHKRGRLTTSTGQAVRSRRQQSLPFPERQERVPLPPTQEPSPHRLDRPLQEAAEKGYL